MRSNLVFSHPSSRHGYTDLKVPVRLLEASSPSGSKYHVEQTYQPPIYWVEDLEYHKSKVEPFPREILTRMSVDVGALYPKLDASSNPKLDASSNQSCLCEQSAPVLSCSFFPKWNHSTAYIHKLKTGR